MIKLNKKDGGYVYLNPKYIISIQESSDYRGYCKIKTETETFTVSDYEQDIINKINEDKQNDPTPKP